MISVLSLLALAMRKAPCHYRSGCGCATVSCARAGRVFLVTSELSRQLRHLIEEEHKCFATFMACISHGVSFVCCCLILLHHRRLAPESSCNLHAWLRKQIWASAVHAFAARPFPC